MRTITKQFIINSCLLALLSLASVSCVKRAGGSELRPPDVRRADTPAVSLPQPASANTLRVWRDFSKSTDEEMLAKIVDELASAIMRHKEQIVGVEIVRFAEETNSIWAAMPEKFIWGTAPEVPEFELDMTKAPPPAKLFKDAKEEYIQSERRKYEERKALLLSEYKARVDEQMKKFRDYLLQSPVVGAPCTRFAPLAERMRAENLPYSVLITDGWADCPDEKGHAPNGVELRGRHAVIQLTRYADSQANDEEFLRRNAFLRGLFPTSEVLPASMPDHVVEFIFR